MAIQLVRTSIFRSKRDNNINIINYDKYFTKKKYFPYPLENIISGYFLIITRIVPKYSRALKLFTRFMLLSILLVVVFGSRLPSIYYFQGPHNHHHHHHHHNFGQSVNDVKSLTFLIRDLTNEGLIKTDQESVFVMSARSNDNDDAAVVSRVANNNEMEVISAEDTERQSSVPDDTFGFAFSSVDPTTFFSGEASRFIDRSLKVGGVVSFQLNDGVSLTSSSLTEVINKQTNYKVIYLRQLTDHHYPTTTTKTFLAMRKTGGDGDGGGSGRRLLGYADKEAAKKAALEKLEDVLLEPPRAASGKSRRYLRRTRYLPDLMGDSLEGYARRVFIDVGLPEKEEGGGGGSAGWFAKNYPTRNKDFEMYKIETTTSHREDEDEEEIAMLSEWLEKNVREEEYVVMKAEAEAVEEMVKTKAIRLVDELFLECKPNQQRGHGGARRVLRRRPYWECLALYGRLRDEGVAVHQWWG